MEFIFLDEQEKKQINKIWRFDFFFNKKQINKYLIISAG